MPDLRRSAAALACGTLLLAGLAAPAAARSPAACVNMAHQLVHYETMRERAAELNNAMWVDRLDTQMQAVEERLATRCPDEAANVRLSQQIADLMRLAAQGAITFFTMGAY